MYTSQESFSKDVPVQVSSIGCGTTPARGHLCAECQLRKSETRFCPITGKPHGGCGLCGLSTRASYCTVTGNPHTEGDVKAICPQATVTKLSSSVKSIEVKTSNKINTAFDSVISISVRQAVQRSLQSRGMSKSFIQSVPPHAATVSVKQTKRRKQNP